MSWIVSMMRMPAGINALAELTPDFETEPLGSYSDVMAVLKSLFPDANYSDPTWIGVYSDQFSEIIFGIEDPVYSIGFRNPSLLLIQEVFEKYGWRGIDPSNGRIIPPFIPPEYYRFPATGS
jgi:hypothetical protein